MAQKTKIAVVYTEGGKAICPECFSRPSVDGRIAMESRRGTKGWGLTVSDGFFVTQYPCSNPVCACVLLHKTPSEGQKWKKPKLTAAKQRKFETGSIGRDGIWREKSSKPTPAPKKTTSVVRKKIRRSRKK